MLCYNLFISECYVTTCLYLNVMLQMTVHNLFIFDRNGVVSSLQRMEPQENRQGSPNKRYDFIDIYENFININRLDFIHMY